MLLNWGADASTRPDEWLYYPPRGIVDQAELDAVLLNWGATSRVPSATASIAPPVPSAVREIAPNAGVAPLPKFAKPLPEPARDSAFDAFPPTALDHLLAASLV